MKTAFATPLTATNVASAVRRRWGSTQTSKVRCVFSPFEADAQLVSLVMEGAIDAVVTEDSDLLVYSMSTNTAFPVLFKLDPNSMECDVLDLGFMMPRRGVEVPNLTPLHGKDDKFSGLMRYINDKEKRFGEGR